MRKKKDNHVFKHPEFFTCLSTNSPILVEEKETYEDGLPDVVFNNKPISKLKKKNNIVSWNFDLCKISTNTIFWVMIPQKVSRVLVLTFKNGTAVEFCAGFGNFVFVNELGKFVSAGSDELKIGMSCTTSNNEQVELVNKQIIPKFTHAFSFIPRNNNNFFASNILVGSFFSNLHPIKHMKFFNKSTNSFTHNSLETTLLNFKPLRLGEITTIPQPLLTSVLKEMEEIRKVAEVRGKPKQ